MVKSAVLSRTLNDFMCNFIKQDYIITFIKSIQLKYIVIFYVKVYYSFQNTVFKRVRWYFVTFTGLGVDEEGSPWTYPVHFSLFETKCTFCVDLQSSAYKVLLQNFAKWTGWVFELHSSVLITGWNSTFLLISLTVIQILHARYVTATSIYHGDSGTLGMCLAKKAQPRA
jgi:hypothetical protein